MCSLPSRKSVRAPDGQNEILKWTAEKFGQRADDEWRSKVVAFTDYLLNINCRTVPELELCSQVLKRLVLVRRDLGLVLTGVEGVW